MNVLARILNLLRRSRPEPLAPTPVVARAATDWDLVLPVVWPLADGWRTVVVPVPLVTVYVTVVQAIRRELVEFGAERN